MIESAFVQLLVLLAAAVATVLAFYRWHLPPTLGYLLVGVVLGPYALAVVSDAPATRIVAEFGVVFLLFTIGLNFSLPQILAMRSTIFGLGTAQVAVTTAAVALLAWAFGMPAAAAFVIGAVAAQSSTTIISRQLTEQGEESSRHGRLGLAMSVFQDVTAVPFLVVIPVLGASAQSIAPELALALAKAAAAFAVLLFVGRWLLRGLFRTVATFRSAELFTLTVLLVSLVAAGITWSLGLSLALGAFIAGMILGDTEFRHQVETTIRPFRDVLLGLFFVTIGMLLDVRGLPAIWHWALGGAAVLLLVKTVVVVAIVRLRGLDLDVAIRTGLVLAVGGEFGFALLAIALPGGAIEPLVAQVLLTSVVFTFFAAPFLMRHAGAIAGLFARVQGEEPPHLPSIGEDSRQYRDHVLICGYGRVGQNVAAVLQDEGVPFVAFEREPSIVRDAHAAGLPVYYGDTTDAELLAAAGVREARLVVISHSDVDATRRILAALQVAAPHVPVMVRTRDEVHVAELAALGATEVVPETLEAALMIASHALLLAGVPPERVIERQQLSLGTRYRMFRDHFLGESRRDGSPSDAHAPRLDTLVLEDGGGAAGRALGEIELDAQVQSVVRAGVRVADLGPSFVLRDGDVVVLAGTQTAIERSKNVLLGLGRRRPRPLGEERT